MKILRYPILFLAVILLPTWLTTVTGNLWGYFLGYLLIYGMLDFFGKNHYPKRIRTTYLITNMIVALLLWGVLSYGIAVLYAGQPLSPSGAVIFIGLPWVSVQMLLLLFFVQSENVLK